MHCYVCWWNVSKTQSPSSRGRGLKCFATGQDIQISHVALFTRAWIEILSHPLKSQSGAVALFTRAWIEIQSHASLSICRKVALFTRAWIEIALPNRKTSFGYVALFTRAWIEIQKGEKFVCLVRCRPLHEGVD